MKKNLLLFVFACFVNLFLGSSIFAQSPQPTPNPQFLYYCLNEAAVPLAATPSGGGTLRWYAAATGGIFSTTAPTPPTAIAATGANPLMYYVTQVIGGVESSPRTPISVYVNQKLDLFCKGVTPNSVSFDFANTGQSSFTYSYTVDGGIAVTGTHTAPSNFTVSGLNEGQTVVFTLTAIGAKPCVVTETEFCKTICTTVPVPNFPAIAPFCSGSAAPILGTKSPNNLTGTWSPPTVSNTTSGSYMFTPDPVLFPCATTQTLTVTIGDFLEPNFTDLSVCYGAIPPDLETQSPNGINGSWAPAVIDNTTSGTYDFTPDPGQCAVSKTINVDVHPLVSIANVDYTVTEAFADNQVISLVVTPAGEYLYQLDDGPFQEKSSFEFVSYGLHSITVKDKYGCGLSFTVNDIQVIDYPRFFTPNGDNYNDTWNVNELQDDLSSKIHIFDRYGKLLKEIRPNGNGWNGIYNGSPLPADDYWFVIQYTEQNIRKEFKSHFSLKR